MPNAVVCAGCGAGLAVPPGAAGKALRCPRCATVNTVPGAAPAPEPPPRVRAERARREPGYDDDPPPRRRRARGVPRWAWGVGAAVVGVGAVVALGLTLAARARDRDATPQTTPPPDDPVEVARQRRAPETWVRGEHAASGATWEFPHTGEVTATSATVRFPDQKTLTFSVTITDVKEADKRKTVYHPLTRVRLHLRRGNSTDKSVERTGYVGDRPMFVRRFQNHISLVAADWDREYEFAVVHPKYDEGEARVKRFFESVRFTTPAPPEPGAAEPPGKEPVAAGESIPAGWDRVKVPRTAMTVLVPKGPVAHPNATRGLPPALTVSRGLVRGGEPLDVCAAVLDSKTVGLELGEPPGGGAPTTTAGGRPARVHHAAFGGYEFVHLIVELGDGKAAVVRVCGPRATPAAADVKRVVESVSFTLPAKDGPDAPDDLTAPPWARRQAPGGFSVELPGVPGAANEGGVALGAGVAWGAHGFLPLPGRKHLRFVATAVGIAAGPPQNPWRTIDTEYKRLGAPKGFQPVRRVEVGGRPGFVAVQHAGDATTVQMKVQDVVMLYTLTAHGPGITADTPDVRRFLESAVFGDPAAKAAPAWARRRLDGSGFSAEMPPGPKAAAPPKGRAGDPVTRVETGQLSDGKGGTLTFTASYVGTVRPTDPGPPPDLIPGHALVGKLVDEAKARPATHRHLITLPVQDRPAARVVIGEKGGGPVVVRLHLAEGDRLYTLQVEGRGITENTPEVMRFFGTAEFADGKK